MLLHYLYEICKHPTKDHKFALFQAKSGLTFCKVHCEICSAVVFNKPETIKNQIRIPMFDHILKHRTKQLNQPGLLVISTTVILTDKNVWSWLKASCTLTNVSHSACLERLNKRGYWSAWRSPTKTLSWWMTDNICWHTMICVEGNKLLGGWIHFKSQDRNMMLNYLRRGATVLYKCFSKKQ